MNRKANALSKNFDCDVIVLIHKKDTNNMFKHTSNSRFDFVEAIDLFLTEMQSKFFLKKHSINDLRFAEINDGL